MSKGLLLTGILLLGTSCWVLAQMSPGATNQASTGNATSSAQQATVRGCLQGTPGNFKITNELGKSWPVAGDDSQLSQLADHTVTITGSWIPSANGSALQETNVTDVSKGCNISEMYPSSQGNRW